MLILVVLTWVCKFVMIKCICKRMCLFDSQYNTIRMKYQSETIPQRRFSRESVSQPLKSKIYSHQKGIGRLKE